MMGNKRFIIPFTISLVVYAILDFSLNYSMIYITGGLIGGTISEAFKAIGVDTGIVPIALTWIALVIGIVALFYRLRNKPLKYFIIFLIAALLYVVDIFIGEIGETFIPESEDEQKAAVISRVILWVSIISRSLILSLIVYLEAKAKSSIVQE